GLEGSAAFAALCAALAGAGVVVNAAGLATPGEADSPELTGANALLPAVIALAAAAAGVERLIHLSSAAVQGHRPTIDESRDRAPFSAYSRSKALGEEALEELAGAVGTATNVVVLRATSVQGATRPTTRSLVKIAASPLASVAAPGAAPTPVSSIDALAWFVVETGLFAGPVPAIVLQPWEGLSVAEVLAAAGGRRPLHLPAGLCRLVLTVGYAVSGLAGDRLHGQLRRVELMWFGQRQHPGWAHDAALLPAPAAAKVLRQALAARHHPLVAPDPHHPLVAPDPQ
ncbi:NAD-dependent epimerase/dehydratase family protein, partial [Specibacter sp. RAF43]|uniref:NAD-dependent epimerase/dehydratase family protein n=1 Tax=Specibacter sp. RAF43 TaxID=3233057 RepID=UPI003F9E7DAF